MLLDRAERFERLAAYNALPTVYTQNLPLGPSPNAITTPYPGAMRNPAVSFQCFALRPTWQCLDMVGINPGSAAVVHVKDSFCPMRLSVAGVDLSLLAVLDESIREGVVLVPAWVFQVLTFEEGAYADISALQPPKSSRGTAGHGSDGSAQRWHVHLEGPLTSKFDHNLTAPFFSCGSEFLHQTMLRQIRRAGIVIGHTNNTSGSSGKAGGSKVTKPIPKAMPVSSMSDNASWGSGGNSEGGAAASGGKTKKTSVSASNTNTSTTAPTTSIFDQGSQVPSSSNIFESGIFEQLRNSDGAAAGQKGAAAAKEAAARVAAATAKSAGASAAAASAAASNANNDSSNSPGSEQQPSHGVATAAPASSEVQTSAWSKSTYVNGPALVAVRMMSQVVVFRVVKAYDDTGKTPDPGTWARPTSLSISQAVDFDRTVLDLQSEGPSRAIRLLTEAGFSASGQGPSSVLSGLRRKGLLIEGVNCGAQLPHFLAELRKAVQDELGINHFVHFPLMELAWDLPSGGDPSKTLRRAMAGIIRNMLPPQDENMPPSMVVLWSLEGPAPAGWGQRLELAVRILANLHPSITLLGLAKRREDLPGAIQALFEPPEKDLPEDEDEEEPGARPARSTSTASSKDKKDGGSTQKEQEHDGKSVPLPIVVGCEDSISRLTATVLFYYKDYRLFKKVGAEAPPRVLIHGPPGSGKTHLLTWLCTRLAPNVRVAWLHSGDVWSKYLGDSELKIRTAFKEATQALKTTPGSVLIIENIHLLAPQSQIRRGSNEANDGLLDRVTATLLTCLDGVDTPMGGSGPGLTVIATSTVPAETLDSRITRPGRMDVWIPMKMLGPPELVLLLRKLVEAAVTDRLRPSDDPGSMFSTIIGRARGAWTIGNPSESQYQSLLNLMHGMTPQALNRFVLQFERKETNWAEVVTALENEPGAESRAAAKKILTMPTTSSSATKTGKGSKVSKQNASNSSSNDNKKGSAAGTRQGSKGTTSGARASKEALLAQASQVALPDSSEDDEQKLSQGFTSWG